MESTLLVALVLAVGNIVAGDPMDGGFNSKPDTQRPRPSVQTQRRILIVEDEFFVATALEAIVQAGGYEVVGLARSAEEAIELAGKERPDLVLMDIRLSSDRDGIDAAIEIRQRYDITSLIVSAHIDEHTRFRASPAAPCGFVEKPVRAALLMRAIGDALKL